MKSYYEAVFISESFSSVHQKRFETLTSLYHFFHGYLKCKDYNLYPRVFVIRYWQFKERFYPAGSVSFFFDNDPKDYRNNRWIKYKIRYYFDGKWVFNYSTYSFVPFHDDLHFLSKVDFRKWKVQVHANNETPF